MSSLPSASAPTHTRRFFPDREHVMYAPMYAPYGMTKEAVYPFGRILWSDDSDASETIHEDPSSFMADPHELFHHHSVHPPPRHMTNGIQQLYPHLHPTEMCNTAKYPCLPQGFGADAMYESEHATTRYLSSNDGLPGTGSDMAEVAYLCSAQGGCLSIPRQPSYVRVDPTNGYPCGAVVCPPGISRAPTPNLPPWMFPSTAPTSPYSYPTNLPCISPSSLYPMVYPQPMVFRVVPPLTSPPISYAERRPTERIYGHRRPESQLRAALTSSPPVSNGNAPKPHIHRYVKTACRERIGRQFDSPTSTKGAMTHSVTPSTLEAHPKISCVNDRVLSKFKTSKGEQFKIQDIRGHLLAFCLDQAGSRFIQEQLALSTLQETDVIHEELGQHALTLMRDVFGNYIIQILLQQGSSHYRYALAEILMDNTLMLTLHVYGCRVIQKALEVLDLEIRWEIIRNLDTHVTRCIKDMNGNHVIQKAIREFDLDKIPFIVKAVQDRVLSFSVHPYGCRVVQRILEKECINRDQDKAREKIMFIVAENIGELSQDLYGNYVAQHVLRFSEKPLRETAIEALMRAPVDYACHKYASNVLEQALLYSDQEQRQKMVRTILSSPHRGESTDSLCMLTCNRFGNYVVQRMLDVAEDDLKCLIVGSIGQRLKSLKKFKYGKHIVARVEKMLSRPPSENEDSMEGDAFSASSIV